MTHRSNPAEEIKAAIDKLTALKAKSTPGPWMDWHSNMADENGVHIPDEQMDPEDYEPFYCPPVTGVFLMDVHGRKTQEANADLIVTLHATIDAQMAVMRNFTEVYRETHTPYGYQQSILTLARAINGGA